MERPISISSLHTLAYLAPRDGAGGVGDYATDFVAAARPYFHDVVEIRHPGPGRDRLVDIRRAREAIADVVREVGAERTIVHGELSGGSLVPFWAVPRSPEVRVTFTMHDAPRPVWYPFRTASVARAKGTFHLVQFPVDRAVRRLERNRIRGRSVFVLSAGGAHALQVANRGFEVLRTHHLVPRRDAVAPVSERPLAVGLFGHVYRGKGFDQLAALRRSIDPSIEMRVAGRGTESLPTLPGVRVLGAVEGPAEDDFFASIRILLVPYAARQRYGGRPVPASGTVARALAYATPVAGFGCATLDEVSAAGAGVTVPSSTTDLADWVNASLRSSELLHSLAVSAGKLRESWAADRIVTDFLTEWSR